MAGLKKIAYTIVLLSLSAFGFHNQLQAAGTGPEAGIVVNLDTQYSIVLWHSLTKTQVTEQELVDIFCKQPFSDAFNKREQIKNAKIEYSQKLTRIAESKTFIATTEVLIKPYDFDTGSFPLAMQDGNKSYILPTQYQYPLPISGSQIIFRGLNGRVPSVRRDLLEGSGLILGGWARSNNNRFARTAIINSALHWRQPWLAIP